MKKTNNNKRKPLLIRATEKLSETKKRHKAQEHDEEANISPKRKRSLNIADILKESVEVKRIQQQEEADLNRSELEIRAANLQQQQECYAGCLQQQQAFNMAMMNASNELSKTIRK